MDGTALHMVTQGRDGLKDYERLPERSSTLVLLMN